MLDDALAEELMAQLRQAYEHADRALALLRGEEAPAPSVHLEALRTCVADLQLRAGGQPTPQLRLVPRREEIVSA